MYAAAGGASLASRQARRNVKKQHVIGNDAVHQQLQKRFNQLHQQHAPAASGIDQKHSSADPSSGRHLLRTAPVGLHSRLPSYVDLNGRITGFGSCDVSEVGKTVYVDTSVSVVECGCVSVVCLSLIHI